MTLISNCFSFECQRRVGKRVDGEPSIHLKSVASGDFPELSQLDVLANSLLQPSCVASSILDTRYRFGFGSQFGGPHFGQGPIQLSNNRKDVAACFCTAIVLLVDGSMSLASVKKEKQKTDIDRSNIDGIFFLSPESTNKTAIYGVPIQHVSTTSIRATNRKLETKIFIVCTSCQIVGINYKLHSYAKVNISDEISSRKIQVGLFWLKKNLQTNLRRHPSRRDHPL